MQQGLRHVFLKRTRFTIITRILFSSTFGLGYLLAFVWGGLQLRNGVITFGVMTSFLQLVGQIQHPIMSLLNTVPQLINATASIDRLEELEKREVEDDAVPHSDLPAHSGESAAMGVSLDDVSFRYAMSEHLVLNHLTCTFLPGSKTALMGPTGIGKTTLFRLMLALIRPACGEVKITVGNKAVAVSPSTRKYFVFVKNHVNAVRNMIKIYTCFAQLIHRREVSFRGWNPCAQRSLAYI